jgi:hypothetical protein
MIILKDGLGWPSFLRLSIWFLGFFGVILQVKLKKANNL